MANSRRITTPIFRLSYFNLFEPGEHPTAPGKYFYDVNMVFEPDADLSEMEAIVDEVANEHWKGNIPKVGFIKPFRPGVWKSQERPNGFDLDKHPAYEGKIIVRAAQNTKKNPDGGWPVLDKPGIVGPDPNDISFIANAQQEIYSGCYCRASISAWVSTPPRGQNYENRVLFNLHALQKCYDGERLSGRTKIDPTKEFEVFDQPVAVGANNDLFDDM